MTEQMETMMSGQNEQIQTIHTVVLTPSIRIYVDFAERRVQVTQDGAPLASASASAGTDRMALEVQYSPSIPVGRGGPGDVGVAYKEPDVGQV